MAHASGKTSATRAEEAQIRKGSNVGKIRRSEIPKKHIDATLSRSWFFPIGLSISHSNGDRHPSFSSYYSEPFYPSSILSFESRQEGFVLFLQGIHLERR